LGTERGKVLFHGKKIRAERRTKNSKRKKNIPFEEKKKKGAR